MDGQRRGIQALCQQVAGRRLADGGSVNHRETRKAFEAAYIAPMQTRALHLAAIERHSPPGMACQGTQTRGLVVLKLVATPRSGLKHRSRRRAELPARH
jgi:hypothetical protein